MYSFLERTVHGELATVGLSECGSPHMAPGMPSEDDGWVVGGNLLLLTDWLGRIELGCGADLVFYMVSP